jgi:hypothetical protein
MRNIVVYRQSHRNCGPQIMLSGEGAVVERVDSFRGGRRSAVLRRIGLPGGQTGYRAKDRMILATGARRGPPRVTSHIHLRSRGINEPVRLSLFETRL